MSKPYTASEDSALLKETLKSYSGGLALEIGAGNGGNLVMLANGFQTTVGTDIAMPGMTDWRTPGANFVIADGASCLRSGSFDLVAFNPPYLPIEVGDDPATEGGPNLEVPKAFLQDAFRTVRRTGRIVMLLNNQALISEFEAQCSREGFRLTKVANKHLFFEELTVYEASPFQHGASAKIA